MNKEQMLEKFKGLFKSKVALAVENSIELSDGSLMTSNGVELAQGVSVFSVDAEDNSVPMIDGNYDLADGTKFTVKDGMIETYGEYTPEAEVVEAEENVEVIVEPSVEMEALKAEIDSLKMDIQAIYEMLNMSGDAVVEMRSEIEKTNTSLSKIPASLGVQKAKIEKTNQESNRVNLFLEKIKSQKQIIK